MKSLISVLIRPLATRIGALIASGTAGAMVVDPAIATRLEAWVMAGALLAADLLAAHVRSKTKEGR